MSTNQNNTIDMTSNASVQANYSPSAPPSQDGTGTTQSPNNIGTGGSYTTTANGTLTTGPITESEQAPRGSYSLQRWEAGEDGENDRIPLEFRSPATSEDPKLQGRQRMEGILGGLESSLPKV